MRMLALVIALLGVPAFAADYSPWPGRAGGEIAESQTAQGPATSRCVPCGGCRETMCCCPMAQNPTCVPGSVTKLPNGNTECGIAQCGCR